MTWESFTILLDSGLDILAEFQVIRGAVHEFQVSLRYVPNETEPEWIVRYETHGGRAHKHERWNADHEGRHKHPNEWRGTHAELVTQAIEDLKMNWQRYLGEYRAWTE